MNTQKRVLGLFVGAHVVNDFYATIIPAFLPALADEFSLDYTELGILSFAATLFTGILQPTIGHAADRYGKRRFVTAAGFAAGGVGFLAMAASPSFWVIVAVSLLVGLGAATYHPQATAFIVAAYPAERGRTLGIHGWGGSIGHFAAPAAATFAVAAIDWRAAMVVIAIPLLITAVVIHTQLNEVAPNPTGKLRAVLSRDLLIAAFMFGLLAMVLRSFLTFTVKMLVDEGWSETGAGTALTVILLVGAIAQPVAGRVFDRVGLRIVLVGACLGSSLAILMFSLTSGRLSLVAIGAVAFFGFSLFPVGLAVGSQLASDSQTGAAVGVIFGISGLMGAAAQPIVGALAEQLGDIRQALSWTIVVTLIAIPMTALVKSGHVDDAKKI